MNVQVDKLKNDLKLLAPKEVPSEKEHHLVVHAQQSFRGIELTLQQEQIHLSKKFLEEKLTGTPEEKEILKSVLASSASATQISELAKEKQTLIARAQALELAEAEVNALKTDMDGRAENLREREQQLKSALEKAFAEQKDFEESSAARLKALEDKETKLTSQINELKTYHGDESSIAAILELKRSIAHMENQLLEKDKLILKLEQAQRQTTEKMRETVDALVDKAAESLAKEMSKQEERIEKREELVSAQSTRLESEMAKVQGLVQADKLMKDAENKLKRATEQQTINQRREEELLALARQIEAERDSLRKQDANKNKEEVDKMALAFDHRARGLHQQIKELKANEKQLNAKIARLEGRSSRSESRGEPGVTPKDHSRLQTGDAAARSGALDAWDSRFLDPENPTVEELREVARRLSDEKKDLDNKTYKMTMENTTLRSSLQVQMAEVKLRQEELDVREAKVSQEQENLSSKIKGPADLAPDSLEQMQLRLKIEMDETVAEFEQAKRQQQAKNDVLLAEIREAEHELERRKGLLSSKNKVVDFMQEAEEAAVEWQGYRDHSQHLTSLVSSESLHISHLVALQQMYADSLAVIHSQVFVCTCTSMRACASLYATRTHAVGILNMCLPHPHLRSSLPTRVKENFPPPDLPPSLLRVQFGFNFCCTSLPLCLGRRWKSANSCWNRKNSLNRSAEIEGAMEGGRGGGREGKSTVSLRQCICRNTR
jgi:hypothetical protein